ncbi:MAG: circadian clock protein KaiC [bacterium]|nr:circadian clock protein KaiC [bacterium]
MDGEKETFDNPMLKIIPLAKIGTGVDGFDNILNGGYPAGRTTMLKGGPGAGKTLFAIQFLLQGALKGRPGIFVTFEESVEAIRINSMTLGWDLRALEEKGLLFLYHAKLDSAAVTAGPFSLKALIAILDGKSRSMGAQQLVIDAIDILMRRFENSACARNELNSVHEWLDEKKITTLLSIKSNEDPEMFARFGFLDYMADCVVNLDHRVFDQISTRRLRVLKYRGSAFGTNEYPYVISETGISLVPIASVNLSHKPLGAYQASGNKELDGILNGGYRRSSCVLIAGGAGAGKTTLACTFVQAACARGEKALYISYEESPEALESAVLSAGIKLQPAIKAGNLKIISRLPEIMGSDEHLFYDLKMINSFQPDQVVIDAVSACNRMGSGKAPFDYLMRMVNACKERGITCFLTNQVQGSILGEDLSGMAFSSLVDTLIQLRLETVQDELRRSLLILKTRGGKHSTRVHELIITDHGVVLGSRKSAAGGIPLERPGRKPGAARGAQRGAK